MAHEHSSDLVQFCHKGSRLELFTEVGLGSTNTHVGELLLIPVVPLNDFVDIRKHPSQTLTDPGASRKMPTWSSKG